MGANGRLEGTTRGWGHLGLAHTPILAGIKAAARLDERLESHRAAFSNRRVNWRASVDSMISGVQVACRDEQTERCRVVFLSRHVVYWRR